jgi:hypothetical protein
VYFPKETSGLLPSLFRTLLRRDIFSILFFEKIVNEKERSDEKCGIISKEFYKGVIDKL